MKHIIAISLCLLPITARARMVETGECQRFDGVMIFQRDINDPRSSCSNMHGLWVPHVVSIEELPKPGWYPYEQRYDTIIVPKSKHSAE